MAAFVGAVAFLGLAQKMPMTSCVFMLELSRFSVEMLFPIALTMGTALMVEQIIQSKLKSENNNELSIPMSGRYQIIVLNNIHTKG